ncbi:hypothetical protein BDN70DRAFT_625204 [Pholiota conissans]|uniref:Uncharacterized protein n=1 Tax=Pholiota conissans TaxID=109636 RepID=A0A9P5Z2K6_9AGAR|nr:hypothetical protein BDN70DRAFT_625204 [Pholiota conissans]
MSIFYAYINNISDHCWRMVAVFANRAVADEWWRAISTSSVSSHFQRLSPQFYTHDASKANVYDFFTDSRFSNISDQFRGKLLLTVLEDTYARISFSVIPVQEVTDHISGNWCIYLLSLSEVPKSRPLRFYIRSKTDPARYWQLSNGGELCLSNTAHTRFQVKARNVPDGTVMIGSDMIYLHVGVGKQNLIVSDYHHALTGSSGLQAVSEGVPHEFCFSDLENGHFSVEGTFDCLVINSSDSRKESWILA